MTTRTRIVAALSYLGILCFVPLVIGRGNHFIQFHSRQGLVIWLWGVVTLILFPFPLGHLLFTFSSFFILILSAIGVVSVLLGQTWRLPLVYELAEKFWPSIATTTPTIRGFHGSVQRGWHA